MAESFQKSVRYITDFLTSLAPDAKVQQMPEFMFRIDVQKDCTEIRFD
jgi:hypothetical protein